jgi:hypothetical protein
VKSQPPALPWTLGIDIIVVIIIIIIILHIEAHEAPTSSIGLAAGHHPHQRAIT